MHNEPRSALRDAVFTKELPVRSLRLITVGWVLISFLLGWSLFRPAHISAALAAAPTPAPRGPDTVQITNATLKKEAPIELIQSIDLRLSGVSYPGCIGNVKRPTVNLRTDDVELSAMSLIVTCGWKADETVKVTLMDPAGELFTKEYKAVPSRHTPSVYEVDVFFQPGVDAPEGKYRFTLEGSATLKINVFFQKATAPRLYVITEDRFQPKFGAYGSKNRLRLEGFLPNEPVRLFAYQFEGSLARFYGYQDITADKRGQLIIETDLADISSEMEMNFYAYGRETHFVSLERFNPDGYSKTRLLDMDLYCPGAITPRLTAPQDLRAVNTTTKLDIHYQPGFGSRITAQVPGDTPMRSYDYPLCIDHAFWWKVYIAKPFLYGWVPESFLGKYVVEGAK